MMPIGSARGGKCGDEECGLFYVCDKCCPPDTTLDDLREENTRLKKQIDECSTHTEPFGLSREQVAELILKANEAEEFKNLYTGEREAHNLTGKDFEELEAYTIQLYRATNNLLERSHNSQEDARALIAKAPETIRMAKMSDG